MNRDFRVLTFVLCTLVAFASTMANAAFLVSGSGSGSTYKNGYAGPLIKAISPITERELFGRVEDRDGNGTLGNLKTCAATTSDICLGIGQGNIVAKSPEVASGDVCVIRADLEPEYAFLFSRNPQLADYGVIRKNWQAGRIKIYVSKTSSGSKATLEDIRKVAGFDPTKAQIVELESWAAVTDEVRDNPRAVGFTHRFADPSGFLQDLYDDHGMTITGIAERALKTAKHSNGETVYTVNMEVPYDVYRAFTAVRVTPSMGTSVVLFGNCPNKIDEAEIVQSIYNEIAEIPSEEIAVDLGTVSNLINSIAGTGSKITQGDTGWTFFDDMVKKGGDLID